MTAKSSAWLSAGLGLLILLLSGVIIPAIITGPPSVRVTLCLTLVGTFFLACALGLVLEESWAGILRDSRNAYSLSRLQMVAWTWLTISVLLAVVLVRAWTKAQTPDALNIGLPVNLLGLMGISYGSGAVLVPLIKTVKANSVAATSSLDAARVRTGEDALRTKGQLYQRDEGQSPRFTDIFTGDDVANAGIIDISKVQNFCFTALVLIGYTVTIFYRLQNHFLVVTNDFPPLGKLDVTAFVQAPEEYWTVRPDLSLTMLTLIGISHVGYLAYKAMPTGGGAPAASGGAPAPGPLG